MKHKALSLFFWHVLFFFLFYEVRVTLVSQSFEALGKWLELEDGILNLSSLLLFYCYALGSYLVLSKYYTRSLWKVYVGIILVFLGVVSSRYFLEEIIFLNVFGFDNYYDEMSSIEYVLGNLFYAMLHITFGISFYFMHYSRFQEKRTQTLLIEHKKTELAFLRAQMNPHFLFNTLNNIYSLVYQKSDQSLPSLEKLTGILRYSLYEGEGNIALQKEIKIIEDFIALERMRYDYPLDVDFELNGDIDNITIPPFLLLPLVENAFKHGDMKFPFKIKLNSSNKHLRFNIRNNIKEKQKDKVGGIGLENIRKRLELIYSDNCELTINPSDTVFDVLLEIKFDRLNGVDLAI